MRRRFQFVCCSTFDKLPMLCPLLFLPKLREQGLSPALNLHMLTSEESDRSESIRQTAIVPEIDERRKRHILLLNTRSSIYETATPPCRHQQSDVTQSDDKAIFDAELANNDDLKKENLPRFTVRHFDSLKLSADLSHDDWTNIASIIETEYYHYDGFVILVGADTLVYTAAALSFMLAELGKPVIVTGSLIPGNRVHTDMKRNIILALLFAASEMISEVCIVFAEKVFRGNRTIKVSRSLLQPFASPNFPPLATMKGSAVWLERRLLRPAPRGRLTVHRDMSPKILTLKLLPGMTAEIAERLLTTRARAIVICGFGTGNVPIRGHVVFRLVLEAVAKGILVCVCTQNRFGSVDLGSYEAGRQLIDAGAVGVKDMTVETTIVKLKYLLSMYADNLPAVRRLMLEDLRGELSSFDKAHL